MEQGMELFSELHKSKKFAVFTEINTCWLLLHIDDVLDLRKLEEFMPDRVVREQELFSLLRIQRAAEERIYESVKDLENLVEDSNASTAAIAPNIVSGNWEILTEYQNGAKTRLLERIEKEARRTKTLISDMKLFNLVDYGVVQLSTESHWSKRNFHQNLPTSALFTNSPYIFYN